MTNNVKSKADLPLGDEATKLRDFCLTRAEGDAWVALSLACQMLAEVRPVVSAGYVRAAPLEKPKPPKRRPPMIEDLGRPKPPRHGV